MAYIDNWFHFYDTTESFEVHRKQGLINPDSICFLRETGQIYTQKNFFGICRERFEKLEQLVMQHDAQIKNILGIEGPSVGDGIVNNIADLVNFLDGFTDQDNLKDFLDAMKAALEAQIEAVRKALSDRLDILEDEIHNDSENLHNAIRAINTKIDGINTRLSAHDTAIATINTTLAAHIRDYNSLKTNYENFKAYAETKFTTIDASITSINQSITTLQNYFTELEEKFDDVENEISNVASLLEDARKLVQQLEDRFGETLAAIEEFKREVNQEIDDFKATVGAPDGIAPLDGNAQVPAEFLPSYVDDVLEYATLAAFPVTGERGKIYVALDTNLTYRWSGSQYTEISKSLGLGETASTAYPGNKGKKNADDIAAHIANERNPHKVTKAQLGLDKVNNTSDAEKPVSTAQQAAIDSAIVPFTQHVGNFNNPHKVNKNQLGLGNVDNTSDLDKPISTATQAALDVLDNSLSGHIADQTNPHNVTKEQLGLGNVDNTADADKPISRATQNILDTKVDKIVGKGLSTNDFTNADKAKLDRATTVQDNGTIDATIIPVDEEDLTIYAKTATDKVIRLKDRDTTDGMGYKILRLSEDTDNILTQEMINEPNTIYEIRYDFDLAGDTITIPNNCVLKFEGGSLNNGTIRGTKTSIVAPIRNIILCNTGGSWNSDRCYPEWFGAIGDGVTDDSSAMLRCIQFPGIMVLSNSYNINHKILEISVQNKTIVGGSNYGTGILKNATIKLVSPCNFFTADSIKIENSTEDAFGILAETSITKIILKDVYVSGCGNAGISLTNCWDTVLENCNCTNNEIGYKLERCYSSSLKKCCAYYNTIGIDVAGDAASYYDLTVQENKKTGARFRGASGCTIDIYAEQNGYQGTTPEESSQLFISSLPANMGGETTLGCQISGYFIGGKDSNMESSYNIYIDWASYNRITATSVRAKVCGIYFTANSAYNEFLGPESPTNTISIHNVVDSNMINGNAPWRVIR